MRRLRRAESYGPLLSPREFISGESVLYLGRHYRLKVHPNEAGNAKLRGGWLTCPRRRDQTAQVREAIALVPTPRGGTVGNERRRGG